MCKVSISPPHTKERKTKNVFKKEHVTAWEDFYESVF